MFWHEVEQAFSGQQWPQWVGVLVTVGGILLALKSLSGLTKQNRIAEDALRESQRAFLLTNRPRVRVRRVVLVHAPHTGSVKIMARVEFTNIGNTDARIFDLRGGILFTDTDLMPDADFTAMPKGPTTVLRPGETQTFEFETGELGLEDFAGYQDGNRQCFAIGRVRYLDDLHITRETGFCRLLSVNTWRFSSIDDPDFEYED